MTFENEIQGVIFDVDGVLLDSMGIWKDLGARYILSKGGQPEEKLNEILFSMSLEEGADYIRDHYLPDMTSRGISEGVQNMLRDYYFYEVGAKPGAGDLLKTLKADHIRITAATSSPRGHIEKALKRNGLLGYIEKLYTSSEVGSSKHSPRIYNLASDFMGLSPDKICVFEDSLYAVKTAARAGYYTVGVFDENGESDQKGLFETAHIYVRDLTELLI